MLPRSRLYWWSWWESGCGLCVRVCNKGHVQARSTAFNGRLRIYILTEVLSIDRQGKAKQSKAGPSSSHTHIVRFAGF